MKAAFGDRRRSKMHRLQQTLGTDRYAQKRSLLEEHSYYPQRSASSEISASANWTCDSESEVSASGLDARSAENEELHVNPIKGYSLHVVVAAIVVTFVFEIPLRLPYFLYLFFAVPSLHVMLTPATPKKTPHSLPEDSDYQSMQSSEEEEEEEEALHLRSSNMPDSSLSSASSPTTGTASWSSALFPWTLHKKNNFFTDYRKSRHQPYRTYREALSNTIPRVAKSTFECAYSIMRFQLRFRAFLITFQTICGFMTGRRVDAEEYLDHVVRFYVDWFVGINGLVWVGVRIALEDAVCGLRVLFGMLWMWFVGGGLTRGKHGHRAAVMGKGARMTGTRFGSWSTSEPLASVIRRS